MAKNIGREAMILKKRRKELGLTQSDVADAIGVQLQQYQVFELVSSAIVSLFSCTSAISCAICDIRSVTLHLPRMSEIPLLISCVYSLHPDLQAV